MRIRAFKRAEYSRRCADWSSNGLLIRARSAGHDYGAPPSCPLPGRMLPSGRRSTENPEKFESLDCRSSVHLRNPHASPVTKADRTRSKGELCVRWRFADVVAALPAPRRCPPDDGRRAPTSGTFETPQSVFPRLAGGERRATALDDVTSGCDPTRALRRPVISRKLIRRCPRPIPPTTPVRPPPCH